MLNTSGSGWSGGDRCGDGGSGVTRLEVVGVESKGSVRGLVLPRQEEQPLCREPSEAEAGVKRSSAEPANTQSLPGPPGAPFPRCRGCRCPFSIFILE